jgi:hypothetical protein
LFLAGCPKEQSEQGGQASIPPPPMPPPPPAQQQPQVPPPSQERPIHEIPINALLIDDIRSGFHQFFFLEKIGAGTRTMPTPVPVVFDSVVALKVPMSFTKANHFLLYRKTPDNNVWSNYKDIVAIIHGGDNTEMECSFGVEQNKKYYFGWSFAKEISSPGWSKIIYHLSDLVDDKNNPLPTSAPNDAVYMKFDRLPQHTPSSPVNKTIYVEAVYLVP